MKPIRYYAIFLLALMLLNSCAVFSGKRAPINGWRKKDHWWAPSNWHLRKSVAPAPF
jgi:hypothetical protein